MFRAYIVGILLTYLVIVGSRINRYKMQARYLLLQIQYTYNTVQYNTISFIEDDKNKDREVSADTAATETYYMMGINKI